MNKPTAHRSLLIGVFFLVSGQTSASAAGENATPLVQQEATIDRSAPASETTMLNGSVSRIEQGPANVEDGGADAEQLQEARALDLADIKKATGLFRLMLGGDRPVINLKVRTPKMSSEEFRKLEYGVIGLDAILQPNVAGPVVRSLYPSCPAANAGMLPGDRIVKAQDHVFLRGEGQRVLWHIVGGKAGTPVDITVLRGAELITFHLVRMNIEDIQNMRIRSMYEDLLSAFGPPRYRPATASGAESDSDPSD